MMIRTRGRRLVSRLEGLERVYDTQGPRVLRVIFEYGGEPTIVTIFRDENRTEIIEPPPPDDVRVPDSPPMFNPRLPSC